MSKKTILLVFVLCLGLVLTGFNSFYSVETEAEAATDPDFFEFDNETGKITYYDQEAGITDVVIPSEINGYAVTRIGEYAFQGKNITSLEIPDSVTEIETYAFSKNKLTSVEIPDSVTKIGEAAFWENKLS